MGAKFFNLLWDFRRGCSGAETRAMIEKLKDDLFSETNPHLRALCWKAIRKLEQSLAEPAAGPKSSPPDDDLGDAILDWLRWA